MTLRLFAGSVVFVGVASSAVADARQPLARMAVLAFDVTADGQRFVIAQDAQNRSTVHFVLVSGWFEELEAKMRPAR
jgi:hypothetical protein